MGKVIIEVEFEGVRDNAYRCIDDVLNAGVLQDAIDKVALDRRVSLRVTHAMVKASPLERFVAAKGSL